MIDYVVPMVFPDDHLWQADWKKVGYEWGNEDNCRWRSWGTEELLLRAVRKNMPWLRRIYVLLARESQVQPWMKSLSAEPGVEIRLVYHREFIPPQFLPCFVSRTIEMFLGNIPDLSDTFLYGNDDMYPLSPLQPTDFFRHGRPCQHPLLRNFPPEPTNFHIAALAGLNMIAGDFGARYSKQWIRNGHSIAPYLLDSCVAVWERHEDEILENIDRARRTSKAFNQYLYFYWQHFTGNYEDHIPSRRFMNAAKFKMEDIREAILGPDPGILCINDNGAISDWKAVAEMVRDSLAEAIT